MKRLKIMHRKVTAQVDDEDYPLLSRYHWRLSKDGYAQTSVAGKVIALQRIVQGKAASHKVVAFVDGDRLNCQKDNLDILTFKELLQRTAPRAKTSQYKGVFWHKAMKKWCTKVTKDSVFVYVAYFKDEDSAVKAFIKQSKKHNGIRYAKEDLLRIPKTAIRA